MNNKLYAPYIYRTLQGETPEVEHLIAEANRGGLSRLLLLVCEYDIRISERLSSRFSDTYRENYYDWGDFVLRTKKWWNTYAIVRTHLWGGWNKSIDVAISMSTGGITAIGTKEEIIQHVSWMENTYRSQEHDGWRFHENRLFGQEVLPRCAAWQVPRYENWKQNVYRAMHPSKQTCVVCGRAFGGLECADTHMRTHMKVIEGTYDVEYEEVG